MDDYLLSSAGLDGDTALPLVQLLEATKRPRLMPPAQVPPTASPLARARAAASSISSSPARQSALPAARAATQPGADWGALTAGYDKRIGDYEAEARRLGAPPDYAPMQAQMRERGGTGYDLMRASILAGMGPRDMQGMQGALAKMGAEQFQPMKVEGGEIDTEGRLTVDPGFKRQQELARLRGNIEHLEKMKLQATTAAERARAEQLQRELMAEFRRASLAMQQEGLALRRQLAEERLGAGALSLKDRAQIEDRMADDFGKAIKDHVSAMDATQKIRVLQGDAAGRLNPIEQQSAAVLLNKFLDPGSVVREGEFDRVARAQGLYDRAKMIEGKLLRGEFLSPQLVANIRDMAQLYETASQARIDAIAEDYTERAMRRSLEPRNIVGRFYRPPQPAGAPAGTPAGAPASRGPSVPVERRAEGYMPR